MNEREIENYGERRHHEFPKPLSDEVVRAADVVGERGR